MEINKDILGMTLQESEDYLEHHGILGQKWGVRRTPAQLGHKVASGGKKAAKATGKAVEKGAKKVAAKIENDRKVSKAKKAAKKKAEEDAAEAKRKHDEEVRESRSFKSVTKLTDAELNARINRLKREAEYQNLLQQTGIIEAGKKQVQASFLKGVGSVVESTTKAKGKELVDSLLNTDINVQNVKKGKKPKNVMKHSDEYLEHHGVLGMKWGVRHDNRVSRNNTRLDKYKKKESRIASDKYDKQMRKVKKKLNKIEKTPKKYSIKKIDKTESKYNELSRNKRKELKSISKMTLSDMKAEKSYGRKMLLAGAGLAVLSMPITTTASLVGLGTSAVNMAWGAGFGAVTGAQLQTESYKTARRLNDNKDPKKK